MGVSLILESHALAECHSTHTPYGETIAHCPLAMLWTYVRGGRTQRHVARGRGALALGRFVSRLSPGGAPSYGSGWRTEVCAVASVTVCRCVPSGPHKWGYNSGARRRQTVRCGKEAGALHRHTKLASQHTYLWLGPTEQPARAVAARRGTDSLLPPRAPQRTGHITEASPPLHDDTERAHTHTHRTGTRDTRLDTPRSRRSEFSGSLILIY